MSRPHSSVTKKIKFPGSFKGVFSLLVAALYLFLWWLAPEKTALALQAGVSSFCRLLFPLFLVFCFLVVLNLVLTPPQFETFAKSGSGVKRIFFAAIAGILSSGPVYAWYPVLKELRDRGAAPSLMAVFLVNRAVKPALLPMMISLFGWPFVLLFTLLTVAASLCVGFCMDRLFS